MTNAFGVMGDLEPLLDHMDEGVLLHAADGVIVACNRRAAELLGVPVSELVGHAHPIASGAAAGAGEPARAPAIAWRPARDGARAARLVVRTVKWEVETTAGSVAWATFLSDLAPRVSAAGDAAPPPAEGVGHALMNALTVIVGQADLLLFELPAVDPRRARVLDMRAAAERSADLLRRYAHRMPSPPEGGD